MKNLICRIPAAAIRTLEFPDFASSAIGIVEKYNPIALKISGVTNLFKAEMLEVDKITVKERYHPMTKELINRRIIRDKTLGTLLSLKQGYKKSTVTSLIEATNIALPFLDKFLFKITKDSNFVKNKKIELMLFELGVNEELKTALQSLGFTVVLDELRTTFQVIVDTQKDRRQSKSETPRVESRKIILNATIAMNNLFKAIEINYLVEKEVDYMPLVNELNVMLNEYKTILTQRKTLVRNAETEKKTVARSTTTSATVN